MTPQFSECFSLLIGKCLSSVFVSWSSAGTVVPATISTIVPGYFHQDLFKMFLSLGTAYCPFSLLFAALFKNLSNFICLFNFAHSWVNIIALEMWGIFAA